MTEIQRRVKQAALEADRKRAEELDRQIKEDVRDIRVRGWELAAHLSEFWEQRGWLLLGFSHENEWLEQYEELSASHVRKLVKLHTAYAVHVLPPAVKTLAPSKAEAILPAIKRGDVDPEQAISDAQELTRSELREKYPPVKETRPKRDIAADLATKPVIPSSPSTSDDASEPEAVTSGQAPPSEETGAAESNGGSVQAPDVCPTCGQPVGAPV